MENIAIIPARSGSKGLTDKNIRLLCGKPLLAYSIEAARASGKFSEIMVSTDSEEYAGIAREYGAEVPFLRSSETSNDRASSWDVVREVLSRYQSSGRSFESVALLQPTSPLRSAEDIQKAYELFETKKAKSVVGLCEAEHSPLWCNTLPEDYSLKGFLDSALVSKGRQQLSQFYRINGAMYLLRLEHSENMNFSLYEENCYAYLMPRERSVDIDTELDFLIAETILNHKFPQNLSGVKGSAG